MTHSFQHIEGILPNEEMRASFRTPAKEDEYSQFHSIEIDSNNLAALSTGSAVKSSKMTTSMELEVTDFNSLLDSEHHFKNHTNGPSVMAADRFIPNRKCTHYEIYQNNIEFASHNEEQGNNGTGEGPSGEGEETHDSRHKIDLLYKKHLLGVDPRIKTRLNANHANDENVNILRYNNNHHHDPHSAMEFLRSGPAARAPGSIALSVLQEEEESLNFETEKPKRVFSKLPYKVLDAPALQDDFYLNLLDWSAQNVLVVGLGSCVYLWSAQSGKVSKLCELGLGDSVTAVNWSNRGNYLSVGTNKGEVQIWDLQKMKKALIFKDHLARVGALAWNNNILSSGSRDKNIIFRDVRLKSESPIAKGIGHKQEVCGLKWSFDGQQLCSGGNDNKVLIWSLHAMNTPIVKFSEHKAAVKALAWSPHQHGLLATGGGTADRTIRFWNTLTSSQVKCVDTESQVCNLLFGSNVNELVSTHGYSLNEINIWKYPTMSKLATLTGHTYRVLYLAMSPCGQNIVTGAGDETLRFWSTFPKREEVLSSGGDFDSYQVFPNASDLR